MLDQIQSEKTLEDTLRTAREYQGVGGYKRLRPMQDWNEWGELFEIIQSEKPDTVLEIGTAYGGTLYPWCRPTTSPSKVVSVDYGYYGRDLSFYRTFTHNNPGVQLDLIDQNSHSQSTVDSVHSKLDGEGVDYLFIDGDHSYEGVKTDFEHYQKLVKEGGFVAFHDINSPPHINGVGVFWKEIKKEYDHREFISTTEDSSEYYNGIGLLKF